MAVISTSSNHRVWSRFNFQLSFAHPRVSRARTQPTTETNRSSLLVSTAIAFLTGGLFFAIGYGSLNVGHPAEDAYILFRYAEHVATGHGIVFKRFPPPCPSGAVPWAGSRPRCTRGSPRGSRNAGAGGAGGPLPSRRQERCGRSEGRRWRRTGTGRGDAHPVPKRKGGRHDSEHHR